ncbi:hypothetical protein [Mesorhizobium sp. B1-1-5]|uniref:hypothetical protein n=1 Tax=Mesorhizobium sp. B1-1-5 TaxID=2589979 RepID=UPI00112DEFB6|nr:hypothetical protein [Mesorhizobium sp. B1-1-5]TPO01482.1 hypothetical protein FJ980_20740 [Mesorhizobium sp. B1-1-5]
MTKKNANPFTIKFRDGRIIDDLDYQNAEEAVRLYGAQWTDYNAAFTAITDAREEQRRTKTINARADS